MKNKLLIGLLLLVGMVNAQNISEQPFIEVSGQSERMITPDEIYLKVLLAADKSSDYQDLEKKTLKVLKDLGIASEDIMLADAQGNEVSSFFKTGFETQQSLLVKVSTAKQVGQVMKSMRDIGIKEIAIVKVDYSEKEALMNELRIEAMKNAKMKSELMLGAVDAKLGTPLSVREHTWGARLEQDNYRMMTMSKEMISKSSTPSITFKKQKYTSEVTVRFEIVK